MSIKKSLLSIIQLLNICLGLTTMFSCNNSPRLIKDSDMSVNKAMTVQHTEASPEDVKEVVILCGNPGAGKSTLLNAILQKPEFRSGFSIGGLTTRRKNYFCPVTKIKYVDTPGLADLFLEEQAQEEILQALRENKDHKIKIVFVVDLSNGVMSVDDVSTINKVCAIVIDTCSKSGENPLRYGIVFNKVSGELINEIQTNEELFERYVNLLDVKPTHLNFIRNYENLQQADNSYLPADCSDRKTLLKFIEALGGIGDKPTTLDRLREKVPKIFVPTAVIGVSYAIGGLPAAAAVTGLGFFWKTFDYVNNIGWGNLTTLVTKQISLNLATEKNSKVIENIPQTKASGNTDTLPSND